MREIPDGWTNANLAMHDKFAVRSYYFIETKLN
jgi:hypothetical protein